MLKCMVWLLLPFGLMAQKTVLESENLRFKAMQAQDTLALHQLLSPDLVYVHANALRESKQDFIHAVAMGKIRYNSMDRTAIDITQWRRTALVNGEVKVKGLLNGNPFDVHLRYLAVYRKKKGRWALARWQSTRIP